MRGALMGHGFYQRTLVHPPFDGVIRVRPSRVDARDAVRDDVARTLDLWRKPAS